MAEIKNDIKLKLLKNENEEIGRQQKLYAELNTELFKTSNLQKTTGIIPGVEEKRLKKLKEEKAELEQLKLKQLEIEEVRKSGKWAADVFTFVDQAQLNKIDKEIEKVQQLLDLFNAKPAGNNTGTAGTPAPDGEGDKAAKQRKELNDALKTIETGHLEEITKIKKQYLNGDIKTEYEYNQTILNQQDAFDQARKKKIQELLNTVLTDSSVRIEAAKQVADIDQKNYDRQINQANKLKKILLDADPIEAEKRAYETRLRETGLFGLEKENMTSEQLKAFELLEKQHLENLSKIDAKGVREKLKELDAEQASEEAKLAEKHKARLITEGAYQEALLKLQKEYLKKKLAIPGLSTVQTADLNKGLSQNDADTSDSKAKERKSALEKYNLVSPKDAREAELKIIEDFEARGVLTHKEAARAKALIDREYLEVLTGKVKDVADKIQGVTSNLTGAISGFQEAESMSVSRKYDQQIKAAGTNAKKVAKLEEQKEKELNKIRAKYADKQFIVTVAQVVASTAVSAMEAYKAMAGIPVVGPALGAVAAAAAVAYGASQIAVAKEQRDAAKEGYYTGGFTPSGEWDKPQGVVHSDEFIANRFAVSTPLLRPVFDVVDYAQKNNTLGSLKKEDIARAIGMKGFAAGGYAPAPAANSPNIDNTKAGEQPDLGLLISVIDRLNRRLDEPFIGEVSITGRKGIKENLDRYEKMIKNASR